MILWILSGVCVRWPESTKLTTATEFQPSSDDIEPGLRCDWPACEVGQRTACSILLNPPTHPATPLKPLGQPLSLQSFLGPTVGDLVLQADAYGMSPLFMGRGVGGIGVYHPSATENRWKENALTRMLCDSTHKHPDSVCLIVQEWVAARSWEWIMNIIYCTKAVRAETWVLSKGRGRAR